MNQRNNLLGVIPKFSASYSVKFDFNPTRFQSNVTNVLHLTATGGNCCNYGDRIPAVWFHGSSSSATKNRFLICSAINGDGNYCLNSGFIVPRGQWTSVEIRQQKEGNSYKYTVKVGGVLVGSVINRQPKEFSNVKIYGSDNWYNAAQGRMRNLVINPNTEGTKMFNVYFDTLRIV